jgi:hypothetical protein
MKLVDLKIGARLNAGFGLLICMMWSCRNQHTLWAVGSVNARIETRSNPRRPHHRHDLCNGRKTMVVLAPTRQIQAVAIEVNKKPSATHCDAGAARSKARWRADPGAQALWHRSPGRQAEGRGAADNSEILRHWTPVNPSPP